MNEQSAESILLKGLCGNDDSQRGSREQYLPLERKSSEGTVLTNFPAYSTTINYNTAPLEQVIGTLVHWSIQS